MKIILHQMLITILSIQMAFCQIDCIENKAMNILYGGVGNPMAYMHSDYSCDSLLVFSNDAKIVGIPCSFDIYPSTLGSIQIHFGYLFDGDTIIISSKTFRVKAIPAPKLTLGGQSKGTMNLDKLKAQRGLGIKSDVPLQITYKVTSYLMLIVRDHKVLYQGYFENNIFNQEIMSVFNGLIDGDKLIFSSIEAIDENDNKVNLEILEFIISH
jgi:hypothetical protein